MVRLSELCEYLDDYLQHPLFHKDIATNGLQVEGPEEIHTIAYAVDARYQTFARAADAGAQLLLCHHGLYWGRPFLLRGHHYQRVRLLIERGLALYASHLPLDAHPEVGNNATLARKLGLTALEPWSEYHGMTIGIKGAFSTPLTLGELLARVRQNVEHAGGKVQHFGAGPNQIQRVGVVTGDAASQLESAAQAGLDVLITGEPCHVTAMLAEELGLYLVTAGHYATETFGVEALAQHIASIFDVEICSIHAPTFA